MSAAHLNKQRLSVRQGVALGLALLLAALSATRLLTANADLLTKKSPPKEDLALLWLVQSSECKATGTDAQLHHAQELEQQAAAKMRRSVFVPSDGVRAAKLLSEASACFEKAGDPASSQRLTSQWEHWSGDFINTFQNHRLRLELALKSKQSDQALSETRSLQALLKGVVPPPQSQLEKFVRWLDSQQRQLSAKPGIR